MSSLWKLGDVVIVGTKAKRWQIKRLRETEDAAGEPCTFAELEDERGKSSLEEVTRLRKVAG